MHITRKEQVLNTVRSTPGLTTRQIVDEIAAGDYVKALLTALGKECKIYRDNYRWYPVAEPTKNPGVLFIRTLKTTGDLTTQKRFRDKILTQIGYDTLIQYRDELDALIKYVTYPEQLISVPPDERNYDYDLEWWASRKPKPICSDPSRPESVPDMGEDSGDI